MKSLYVRLILTEEVLGTGSSNPELHEEFIASKSPDASTIEEEVAAVGAESVARKQMTVFPRDPKGRPFTYDYQLKGFFKDACSALSRVADTKSSKLKAFKKVIDGCIFVFPRHIPFEGYDGSVGSCQRPLRADTPQGPRVALANSETIPAGATLTFEVRCLDVKFEQYVREWLDYGALRGLGCWRNSGKGRFEWKESKTK